MSAQRRDTLESIVEAGSQALFASGDSPAFATDSRQRITFWNAGAERLLELKASQVVGKPCFEMILGRDVFGNRFCYEGCPLQATLRRGENTRSFELIAHPGGSTARPLTVTAVLVQEGCPQVLSLIHILGPAASESSSASRSGEPAPAPTSLDSPPLTARETQVLRCIARGLQNKGIAERLMISPATVRNHVHHLLRKLHVNSKLRAAALAHRSGWTAAG